MELQKKWFVYMDDHHEGPFSPDEIYQKQKAGSVTQESYVWCEGMPDWLMLEQVAELKAALQQFKEPPPASPAVAKVQAPTVAQKLEPLSPANPSESSPAPIHAPEKKRRSPIALLVTGLLLLIFLAGGALAVLSRSATEETHSLIRPTLARILDRAPFLAPFFKLAPKLSDVRLEDLQELESSMIGTPDNGVKVGLALSQGDPNRPYFYIATNLPDKTKLDFYLIGNGETLLNRLSFTTQTTVLTKFGMGRTDALLAVGGQPIPKGEYQVYVVESNDQDEAIRPLLNNYPPHRVQTQTPADVPAGSKYLFTKTFFVGGERDDTYLTRLKSFHEKVKQTADRELQELKQYTDTLQLQYTSLTNDFGKLYRAKKVTPQLKASWEKSVTTWQQINGQMEQTIQTWTKETLQNEFFYGKTYELIKDAYDGLHKLFEIESEYVKQPHDRAAFEIQHGKALSEARTALEQLKSKVEIIMKSPKTANGLPTREAQ